MKNIQIIKKHGKGSGRGQSIMEFSALFIAIVAALVAMSVYTKRAIQGRLRQGTESIGAQYDPQATNSSYTMAHSSNTTTITTQRTGPRTWTECAGYRSGCRRVTANMVSTQTETITHYDNTYRNGFEIVGAPVT